MAQARRLVSIPIRDAWWPKLDYDDQLRAAVEAAPGKSLQTSPTRGLKIALFIPDTLSHLAAATAM